MTSYSLEYSWILFRYFRSVEEHLKYSQSISAAHRFAFSLFGSVWELLERSVWLFGIAESLSYDFRTILHFADVHQVIYPLAHNVQHHIQSEDTFLMLLGSILIGVELMPSLKLWVMVSEKKYTRYSKGGKKIVVWKSGDIGRCRNHMWVLCRGGRMIKYDEDVVWHIVTSDDVVWRYLWVWQ